MDEMKIDPYQKLNLKKHESNEHKKGCKFMHKEYMKRWQCSYVHAHVFLKMNATKQHLMINA